MFIFIWITQLIGKSDEAVTERKFSATMNQEFYEQYHHATGINNVSL